MSKLQKLIQMYELMNGEIDRNEHTRVDTDGNESYLVFYGIDSLGGEVECFRVSQVDILFDYVAQFMGA